MSKGADEHRNQSNRSDSKEVSQDNAIDKMIEHLKKITKNFQNYSGKNHKLEILRTVYLQYCFLYLGLCIVIFFKNNLSRIILIIFHSGFLHLGKSHSERKTWTFDCLNICTGIIYFSMIVFFCNLDKITKFL